MVHSLIGYCLVWNRKCSYATADSKSQTEHLPLISRHVSLARFSGSSIIALLLGGECDCQIIRFKPIQPSPVPSVFPHVHEGLHRRVACHRCRSRSMMAGFGGSARGCDACRAAPSAVYCPADAAFLCGGCDAQVHGANRVASRHERVWVCEACEVGPAVLFCRADSAALCAACDAEVHSANPLARRHQRVPILSVPLPAAAGTAFLSPTEELHRHNSEEDEAESWLLINTKNCHNQGALFSSDQVDGYFDLVSYNDNACNEIRSQEQQIQLLHQQQSEGVVPSALCSEQQRLQKQEEGYGLAMEYEVSNCTAGFSYTANSTSNSVSFTSMDASIVPRTRETHISDTHNFANSNGLNKLLPCPPLPQIALQFPMDREAKVLKYREKRKTRKFSKTIRYELRKTYAEMRPRIKGRFAKRSDAEHEMEQMFSTPVPSDGGYDIVPSF